MVPRNFVANDKDEAGRFFDAVDTICDMCTDGAHCSNCALTVIRESIDVPDGMEVENDA